MSEIDDFEVDDMPPLPEPGEDGVIPPQWVPDESIAEDAVRYLGYWYKQRDDLDEQFEREKLKLQERYQKAKDRIGRRIAHHEGGLMGFLFHRGIRKWRGLRGTVSIREGRKSLDITDVTKLEDWARKQEDAVRDTVLKIELKPSKEGIWQVLRDSGELPDGVELVHGDDKLVVKVD